MATAGSLHVSNPVNSNSPFAGEVEFPHPQDHFRGLFRVPSPKCRPFSSAWGPFAVQDKAFKR